MYNFRIRLRKTEGYMELRFTDYTKKPPYHAHWQSKMVGKLREQAINKDYKQDSMRLVV